LPSTDLAPSLFILWKPGEPSHRLDLTLFSLSCRKRWSRRCHHRRRSNHGGTPGPALVPACKVCARSGHQGLRRRRFPASPSSDDLGEPLPCETLAGVASCARMQTTARTTAICRRLPPNRMARTRPYRFVHPGLAGVPAGLDPAQIWPSLARSGLCFFFFCVLSIC
jgi:hypothetical protein